jgi:hypothetical protein
LQVDAKLREFAEKFRMPNIGGCVHLLTGLIYEDGGMERCHDHRSAYKVYKKYQSTMPAMPSMSKPT